MTTFYVFSITRGKEINMDTIETSDREGSNDIDELTRMITPPYQGRCIVVRKDDVREFKLKSHVVEV